LEKLVYSDIFHQLSWVRLFLSNCAMEHITENNFVWQGIFPTHKQIIKLSHVL
jgi:hypothetical protein